DEVPLLARHLAGLAADAHGGVGEEALARRRILVAAVLGRVDVAEEGPTEAGQEGGHGSVLLSRFCADPGAAAVALHELREGRTAWSPPRDDVTARGLGRRDRHVGVEILRQKVVGRVADAHPVATP